MYFSGNPGFIAFSPETIRDNPHPPQLALTDFKLFNASVVPGPEAVLVRPLSQTEQITLGHNQNDLSFDFVALHYSRPKKNQYAYVLEPYHADWQQVGTQRSAHFTNLDPGRYVFRVKAANSDGVWNEAGVSVRVVIDPPWWRTTWAYVLYGLLFIGAVFSVDRVQRRRLRRQAEMEQARLRTEAAERELEQAREIEKAYHQLKATQQQLVQQEKMASLGQLTAGIAHEIKNPLNFINNFAEVNEELADELRDALANGESVEDLLADLKQNASVIAQHGKRADGIVRAMMQHASGGTGQREATDINALVNEYIDLAYHGKRAQVPDLQVEIARDLGAEVGSVEIVPQEIGRVLLNLLGNAFDAVHERADAEKGGRGERLCADGDRLDAARRRSGGDPDLG